MHITLDPKVTQEDYKDRIIRTLERDLIDMQRKHTALREEMNAREGHRERP